jgi:hypothetical protein
MKARLIVPESEASKMAEIERHSSLASMTSSPLTPHAVGAPCARNGRILSRVAFRMLHEAFGAIILATDRQKVGETPGLLDSEPKTGRVTRE